MFNKSNDFLCVSINDDFLKIVHIKGSGPSARVTQVAAKDVKDVPPEELPKIIQPLLKGINLKKSNIVGVISPSITTTKNIEIPSTSEEEINSIVNLQAGRHTPYSRDEIQIGYINIGVYKNNYSKVFLVIANRNVLKTQLSVWEKVGVKVQKLLFAPESIAYFYNRALNLAAETIPVGIIDIDRNSTAFVITLKGKAITARHIPIGKTQLTSDSATARAKLLDELNKTIDSYKSDDIEQIPAKYFITTDDEQSRELQTLLKEKLGWDTQIVSYLDHMKAGQSVLQRLGTDYVDSSFLDVVAATTYVHDAQINLLPEEVQLQKSVEDQSKEISKLAICAVLIMFFVFAGFGVKYSFKKSYLVKLTNQYSKTRQEVTALENLSLKREIVKNYLQERMVSLDVLYDLYKSIPNEMYLTSVTMDEEGSISIQGVSDVASLVFNLGSDLKELELFKSVDIKSTTAKKDRGKDVSAFEISLKLKSADTDEEKAKSEEKKAPETATKK